MPQLNEGGLLLADAQLLPIRARSSSLREEACLEGLR